MGNDNKLWLYLRRRLLRQVLQLPLHGGMEREEVRVSGRLNGVAGHLQGVASLADEVGHCLLALLHGLGSLLLDVVNLIQEGLSDST